MTQVETALLIILTISYATLLALSIVAVSIAIKILTSIRNITDKVESSVDDISGTIEAVNDKIKPVITAGVVKFVMGMITKNKKGA